VAGVPDSCGGQPSDAKAVLIESAQFMERYYTTNGTYAVPGPTPPFLGLPKGSAGTASVRISFSVASDPLWLYTLQAEPEQFPVRRSVRHDDRLQHRPPNRGADQML
jgi:Tfp pilus assembly protein PilE